MHDLLVFIYFFISGKHDFVVKITQRFCSINMGLLQNAERLLKVNSIGGVVFSGFAWLTSSQTHNNYHGQGCNQIIRLNCNCPNTCIRMDMSHFIDKQVS